MSTRIACFLLLVLCCALSARSEENSNGTVRLATFDIDATPPVGSWMAYDPVTNRWDLGLRARGIVLLGEEEPIVLCALDWIGLANEGYDEFRRQLAAAVGTTPSRVAVHALHQHDAPDCDFSAEQILEEAGMHVRQFEGAFHRQVLSNLVNAARASLPSARLVTHLGVGKAKVEEVASNRRIFGEDGKVRAVRYTACGDQQLRAEPEGTIDPEVSLISFWQEDQPLAVLSYYATHPQSYYRTGIPSPDFPGMARFYRQLAVPSALHVHFDGAGGNIGAGKYNDGSPTNRLTLAKRLADGMSRAWADTRKEPLTAADVAWRVESVALPIAPHLSEEALLDEVQNCDPRFPSQGSASRLAWLRRCHAGHKIDLTCLQLGRARILHMPGELFVEYQLAAKKARPDLFVAMAAYGDYAPWYIGTAVAYEEGGYETEARSSNVAPGSEPVLMSAMARLLEADWTGIFEPTDRYKIETIHGFTLRVSSVLDQYPGDRTEALEEAARQLKAIVDTIPSARLDELRKVTIWLEWQNKQNGAAEYHPSIAWLKQNAYNPDKARGIEINNARNFVRWSRQAQPWMLLHELAHAFHHQVLGWDDAEIRAAHAEAVRSGRYSQVKHVNGRLEKAYAVTDEKEFFAELSEAFWGRNDFDPFDRETLRKFDPEAGVLIEKKWSDPEPKTGGEAEKR